MQHILTNLEVRTYCQGDCEAVRQLFTGGLLAGQIPAHDTGADLEAIEQTYLKNHANHFWVAQIDGQVRGMIGVIRSSEHAAEIRRLRIEKAYQSTPIAAKLVETAVEHCRRHGYLKIVFDTRFDPQSDPSLLVDLFKRVGFQHTRTRNVGGKDLHEFYLNLYRQRPYNPQ